MDNIFIVVIVLGAIASFFGKSGSKKRPNQMPNFGGGGLPRRADPQTLEEGHRTESTAERPVYRSRMEQENRTSDHDSYEGGYLSPSRTAQTTAPERSSRRASPYKSKEPDGDKSRSAGNSRTAASVQADDIRKAVVWAEILGPPRAKRPYRK